MVNLRFISQRNFYEHIIRYENDIKEFLNLSEPTP